MLSSSSSAGLDVLPDGGQVRVRKVGPGRGINFKKDDGEVFEDVKGKLDKNDRNKLKRVMARRSTELSIEQAHPFCRYHSL